jgi:hypothetical protein
MSPHTLGGGGKKNVTKLHKGEGGLKLVKKSVTYYLIDSLASCRNLFSFIKNTPIIEYHIFSVQNTYIVYAVKILVHIKHFFKN